MTNQPADNDKLKIEKPFENPGELEGSPELYNDPEYISLIENYQHAQFGICSQLLKVLFERYPDHPRLIDFQKNLDLQLSLKTLEATHERAEKRQKTRKTLRLSAFSIFSILVILVIFAGSYYVLSNLVEQKYQVDKQTQAATLEQQVNSLLTAGQPEVAAGLVEKIRTLAPAYPGLDDLSARTNQLLALENQYKTAKGLLAEGKNTDALVLLKGIEEQSPGLWDVARQITQAENGIKIGELMTEGNAAYMEDKWTAAIEAYEAALALNPDIDDPVMKEQLLNSYLRRIIQMMESSSTTVEDIQLAEQYYRKAVAMIPQNRAFASERGNLEQVSSNLLELKFTQTADALLQERYQTFSSISSAVNYLSKAVNLNPKNNEIQTALKNAQLYQVAFQNALELNWSQAIKNLNQIVSLNPGYANGNARQLLYEAYYSLGKQYLAVGLYTDARSNLEQAEILAFDMSANKLQLYQVQAALGETIARTEDYQNAASYYQYAFNKVNVLAKAATGSELYSQVARGNELAEQGDFEGAVGAYRKASQEIAQIYTLSTVKAPDGVTLPFFAAENNSSTEAIIAVNKLPQSLTITFGRELQIPSIE